MTSCEWLDPQKKIILHWKKIFPDHPGKKIILPSKKNYSTVKTWKGVPFRALEKKLITEDAYMRPVRAMLLEHTCLVGAHGGQATSWAHSLQVTVALLVFGTLDARGVYWNRVEILRVKQAGKRRLRN